VANADDLMHLGDALRVILTAMMVMEQCQMQCQMQSNPTVARPAVRGHDLNTVILQQISTWIGSCVGTG
jgi:hypothetical protein